MREATILPVPPTPEVPGLPLSLVCHWLEVADGVWRKAGQPPRKGQLEVLAHLLIFCVLRSRSHVEADIFVLEIPKSIFLV